MGKDYEAMDRAALEVALIRLRDEYDDLEETITFNFTHTTAHINAGQAVNDEETLCELRQEIEKVEQLLAKV